jgi:O-antigen/teichoic acid export membrane protein
VAFFTRKVLLDHLGTEFIGFTGTLGSLLGFLNLAELGIGTAIGYVLYRPLFDNNHYQIIEIVSIMGYLYRRIGQFIIIVGIILSLFLPLIFSNTNISLCVIFFGFYAFLGSSILGYFANYRQILLSSDQRNYIVTGYFQVSIAVKMVLQAVSACFFQNFYLYLILEFLANLANAIVLQWKISETYPWLKTEIGKGRLLLKKYPQLVKYIRQIFVHKIANFVQFQLSPFLIYAYVSLPMVALYNNYTIVTQRIYNLFTGFMGSTWAGIGSLISEGDKSKMLNVYKELLSTNILIGSFLSSSVYILITPFISIWLGQEYELSKIVVLLISLQLFFQTARNTNDQFISGFGLFNDTWAPIVESLLFITGSIILGHLYGLPGILSGSLISIIIIVYCWKPYFLFTKGFITNYFMFVSLFSKNVIASAIAIFPVLYLYNQDPFLTENSNSFQWIAHAFAFIITLLITLLLSFYTVSSDFRVFCKRITSKLSHKNL